MQAQKNQNIKIFSWIFCCLIFITQKMPAQEVETLFLKRSIDSISMINTAPIFKKYTYQELFKQYPTPIFCKLENVVSLKTQFNIKIRLGNVEYVDALEMKNQKIN